MRANRCPLPSELIFNDATLSMLAKDLLDTRLHSSRAHRAFAPSSTCGIALADRASAAGLSNKGGDAIYLQQTRHHLGSAASASG